MPLASLLSPVSVVSLLSRVNPSDEKVKPNEVLRSGLELGQCKKHEKEYGVITWNGNKSPTCPLCDADNEIRLQSEALIYLTHRLEEVRKPPNQS